MQRTAGQALTVRDTPLAVRVIRSYQLYLLLLPTINEGFAPHLWPQDRHFAYITFSDEEQEELSILQTEIGDYVKRAIARWIVDGNVDAEWDDYLKQLDRIDLPKAMEIYQAAYDRFAGN